jgi:hypothetical protein
MTQGVFVAIRKDVRKDCRIWKKILEDEAKNSQLKDGN